MSPLIYLCFVLVNYLKLTSLRSSVDWNLGLTIVGWIDAISMFSFEVGIAYAM